MSSEVGKK